MNLRGAKLVVAMLWAAAVKSAADPEGAATMQLVEITINKVEVGVRRDDDADVFVGFCPRFNSYSQGETKEEALEAIADAVCLKLRTAFDHGRIVQVLRQAGFEKFSSGTNGATPSPDDEFVAVKFKEGVEVSEIPIRVPLGALLHQRSFECQQ